MSRRIAFIGDDGVMHYLSPPCARCRLSPTSGGIKILPDIPIARSPHLLEGCLKQMWMYELRREDQTLVDQRGSYRSEQEARSAAERARLWIEEARYPYEKLTVVTKPE